MVINIRAASVHACSLTRLWLFVFTTIFARSRSDVNGICFSIRFWTDRKVIPTRSRWKCHRRPLAHGAIIRPFRPLLTWQWPRGGTAKLWKARSGSSAGGALLCVTESGSSTE